MARARTMKVDPEKLREQMRQRGLNAVRVSRELGYSDGYIGYVLKTGTIGMPAAKQLSMRYNIGIDEVKPDAPVEIQQQTTPTTDPATGDLEKQLAELTATVKELKDEFRNYRTAMLGYMKKFENHKKYGHF